MLLPPAVFAAPGQHSTEQNAACQESTFQLCPAVIRTRENTIFIYGIKGEGCIPALYYLLCQGMGSVSLPY